MKKLLTILFSVMLVFVLSSASSAFGPGDRHGGNGRDHGRGHDNHNGWGWGHHRGGDEGPGGCLECDDFAFGSFDLNVSTFGAGFDFDAALIPNGGAFGLSKAMGGAHAGANGFVFDGEVSGNASVVGGGITDTDAYVFFPSIGDLAIGVGSASFSQAVTGGSVSVAVDPDQGFGYASGYMRGRASQRTLNMSGVGESPFFFNSTGFTGGIAGQGSTGSFVGGVHASAGPDHVDSYYHYHGWWGWWWYGGHWHHYDVDSNAGASAEALIDMRGGSYSESYRFVDLNGDQRTEGMGTNVGAFTEVETSSNASRYANDYHSASANAHVFGCFTASGHASTITVQNAPGVGGAFAAASGSYAGSGSLGTNYSGSATGYSSTSVTTVNGMNGSINNAAAGMSVTSKVN